MIPVVPPDEPEKFDAGCRKPGLQWLAAHANADRPRDYWSPFRDDLARGFHWRCGYGAMYCPNGTVDHCISWKASQAKKQAYLAYEWSNLRYVEGWINASKRTADADVLDPYEIGEDWFEVLLPSCQLVLTSRVPSTYRERAESTLRRLHLCDDERIVRQRREWLRMHEEGGLKLEMLEEMAPLVAAAVRRRDMSAGIL